MGLRCKCYISKEHRREARDAGLFAPGLPSHSMVQCRMYQMSQKAVQRSELARNAAHVEVPVGGELVAMHTKQGMTQL